MNRLSIQQLHNRPIHNCEYSSQKVKTVYVYVDFDVFFFLMFKKQMISNDVDLYINYIFLKIYIIYIMPCFSILEKKQKIKCFYEKLIGEIVFSFCISALNLYLTKSFNEFGKSELLVTS